MSAIDLFQEEANIFQEIYMCDIDILLDMLYGDFDIYLEIK